MQLLDHYINVLYATVCTQVVTYHAYWQQMSLVTPSSDLRLFIHCVSKKHENSDVSCVPVAKST